MQVTDQQAAPLWHCRTRGQLARRLRPTPYKEANFPLNNNRNNNRRRGRGNNRGGQGGGNQSNRIDSRARGNAPQMLEKYRKLAHEAQLNDDRVQTEYYLQFADHYFRVIADSKVQKDDQPRGRQQNDGNDDDYDDMGDDDTAQGQSQDRSRPRRDDNRNEGRTDSRGDNRNDNRGEARSDQGQRRSKVAEPAEGVEGEAIEAGEDDNPFTRESRPPRTRKPARKPREQSPAEADADADNGDHGGFDPGVLPPAIARTASDDSDDDEEGERPRRKLSSRSRRSQPRDDDGEEALEAVS